MRNHSRESTGRRASSRVVGDEADMRDLHVSGRGEERARVGFLLGRGARTMPGWLGLGWAGSAAFFFFDKTFSFFYFLKTFVSFEISMQMDSNKFE